ncbi:hypothetical protein DESC_610301 [Desulfosarcina cetonica]|nr:hypothetical protein DESC_610301 [Desulfosarcina cetonica]
MLPATLNIHRKHDAGLPPFTCNGNLLLSPTKIPKQKEAHYEILQSAAQILLRCRSACQENVCLHPEPQGKSRGPC